MPENFYPSQNENQYQPFVPARQQTLSQYTMRVFLTMFLGLLITFGVAWFLGMTNAGLELLWNLRDALATISIVVMVAQIAVVLVMSARVQKISPTAAGVCFFLYSILTGLTFSLIFIAYDVRTLALVFGFTALYFGGMAIFGYLTKFDLSRIRNILLGGLIALVICNLLMLFIPGLQAIDHLMCSIGVVLFLAFTAYDTQKIKAFYYGFQGDDAMLKKAGVISALELYLDFINLFLYLLRLFGGSSNRRN